VIPEGRTGTPNVAGLRRSRLSKAPDQDFVVQVATRDSNALRLFPSPPAGPTQELQQPPQQAPAQAPVPAPQQVPVQAAVPVAQQDPVRAPQQPAAAPEEAPQPAPAAQQPGSLQGVPAAQQPQAEAQPAPAAPEPRAKPQAEEPPRKKKENYLQDWDDAARVRRAFNRTKHITGIENWSEFVSSALLEKAIQLEAQYNEGQPFDGSTKAPMGRPATAE
jgi:hypothetical protein